MPPERIAAVTGANKGIGLAIVRQLALRYPSSPIATRAPGSFLIYLTSRDQGRGEQAVAALHSDPALKEAKALTQYGGPAEIRWHGLDITDDSSVDAFAEKLAAEHGKDGGIDIVVNNAGVAFDGFDSDVVARTLRTNYTQTLRATQRWLPLMRDAPSSRIVNVASAAGRLEFYSAALQQRFRDARAQESGGVEQVTGLMDEYVDKVATNTHEQAGWPSRAYAVSKAGVIGFTGALARKEKQKGFKGLINCCCPGWVVTDMTKGRGFKNIDQGAELPVKLALDDLGGVTGEYWKNDEITQW